MKKDIKGLAVSPGIAIGKAAVVRFDIKIPDFPIPKSDVRLELLKFDAALARSREQLLSIRAKGLEGIEEIQKLLDSQLLILVDPTFVGKVISNIKNEPRNIEKIVSDVIADISRSFQAMKDPYLRERASDIRDIGTRIMRNLLGEDPPPLHLLSEDTILVCDHLNVSEVAHLDPERVKGLVSEIGGETSHPAILARSLGIPAIVGVPNATSVIMNDELIILDCPSSLVRINPSEQELEFYEDMRRKFFVSWESILRESTEDAITDEGTTLSFMANISVPSEVDHMNRYGAKGVGLFRTEYVYMEHTSFPSEDAQYIEYKKVVEACSPHVATIRTLDIGGDKELPYLCFMKEANPFLGWRSIRFCFDNPHILKTQLRALLRASTEGNLRIMFPMIISVEELRKAKGILQEVAYELQEENIPFSREIQVGIMVEVPAAALMAEELAQEADFFSIGTNDLTQFTLAIDRTNQKLAASFSPLAPPVLRLIELTVAAAKKYNIPVSCCGEMTANPIGFLILLGLGVEEFGCNLYAIPQMKHLAREVTMDDVRHRVQKALKAISVSEVEALFADLVSDTKSDDE